MRGMLIRLAALVRKELRQLGRDRLTLGMMVLLPLLQLSLFGWAINTDVRNIPLVVLDEDGTAESRELVRALEATGFYQVVGHARDGDEIERALRGAAARVALVLPRGYGARLDAGRTAEAQLIVDGSDPQIVSSATQTAASLFAERATRRLVVRAGLHAPPMSLEPVVWYNSEQRTAVYIVPGLIGVILTMTMVMLTAMAIARERERGTLEALIVTPIRRGELVIGKILPYVAIGYVQMTLVLVLGWLAFGVPVRGSIPLLYLVAFFFIAANLGLGLFFSTLARTQQQAMQMSFFFLLPNILLSGFMFPFEGMPRPAQWFGQGLPLTHFLRCVRGIALRGSTFVDLRGELAPLVAILVVLVTLASLRFRKQLA